MSAGKTLVLATANPGKLREIRAALGDLPVRVKCLADFGHVSEPLEDGETFADNARAKAVYYARTTGQWCLAEDSGLIVDALDGAPGVRSARWATDHCPAGADRATLDAANNAKLLDGLAGVPDDRRSARFFSAMVLVDASGRILIETDGTVEGRIACAPRGENGFGYDPLFFVPELGCTTAQLPPERKNAISHRGKAVRRFANKLRELLGSA